MKKIFFLAAAFMALTFTACQNKTQKSAQTTDSDSIAAQTGNAKIPQAVSKQVSQVTQTISQQLQGKDAAGLAKTMATVQTTYQQLVKEGKLQEAKTYVSQVQQFIQKNQAAVNQVASGNTTIANLINGVKNLPTSTSTTAQQAAAAVSTDAQAIANGVKSLPAGTKEAAEKTVKNAVDNAKTNGENQVKGQVDQAKQKAADAVNKTSQKASDAVNQGAQKALKGLGL